MKQQLKISSSKSQKLGLPNNDVASALRCLKQSGELAQVFEFIVKRMGDFRLIADETSDLFFDNQPVAISQIKAMIRRDLCNAGMQYSSAIFEHVFASSLRFCVKISVDAMRTGRYQKNESGVYAPVSITD